MARRISDTLAARRLSVAYTDCGISSVSDISPFREVVTGIIMNYTVLTQTAISGSQRYAVCRIIVRRSDRSQDYRAAATLRTSAVHQWPAGFFTSHAQLPALTSAAIAAGISGVPNDASS